MNMRRRNLLATLFLVVLLLAFPAAAAIQTVWLNAASEAEADRMQRALGNAMRQIRAEFAFEFASIATLLPPKVDDQAGAAPIDLDDLSRTYPSFLAAWRDRSRFPGLIDEIIYLGHREGATGDEAAIYRYDPETEQFTPIIESRGELGDGPSDKWLRETVAVTQDGLLYRQRGADPLTLVIPLNRGVDRVVDTGYLLIHLDRVYLATVVVPELASGYLGAGADDYTISVVDCDTEELLWSNGDLDFAAHAAEDLPQVDEIMSISTGPMLSFGVISQMGMDVQLEVANEVTARVQEPLVQQWMSLRGRGEVGIPRGDEIDGSPPWLESPSGLTVLVRHSVGSIGTAARIERNRNLLVSYTVLGLLAATAISFYLLFRRANRLREKEHEFVATVTHELRTPVAAIHAVADNLAEGIVTRPDQIKDYGKAMLDEGRRLRTMIDQVLLYAGLQGGSRVGSLTEINVDEQVARACSQIPELNRDRLTIRAEPRLPSFRGDPIAIESIIRNLVSNAAKHNDESTTISLNVRGDHGSDPIAVGGRFSLVIEVTDNGRGIPRRELHRVREPFFRGAQSQADQVPGSGLGLSLVKRIVDTYGGSLTVNSTSGQGTTVIVRLPCERGE
ncbi:MAG: HAMP domain-containing histidine kinase [Spirochaetales bacterium]|nr:HAMP domain-containing histidine kinase [Spirochaetales bacterium]